MRSLATTLSLLLLAAAPLEAQRIVVAEPGPGAPGRILRETLASTHVVIDQGGEPVLLTVNCCFERPK